MTDCLLCAAERITERHYEDDDIWIADCMVCMTPMVVWREHAIPDLVAEGTFLELLDLAAARIYPEGHWIDGERRKIPDHWHAHARPLDGFFDPRSEHFGKEWPA